MLRTCKILLSLFMIYFLYMSFRKFPIVDPLTCKVEGQVIYRILFYCGQKDVYVVLNVDNH